MTDLWPYTDRSAPAIGRRIDDAMRRVGLNVTQLGLLWGGHRQTAQHWLKGKSFPNVADLHRLCGILGCDANELLGIPNAKRLTGEQLEAHRIALQEEVARLKDAPKRREGRRKAPRKSSPLRSVPNP